MNITKKQSKSSILFTIKYTSSEVSSAEYKYSNQFDSIESILEYYFKKQDQSNYNEYQKYLTSEYKKHTSIKTDAKFNKIFYIEFIKI